MVKQPQFGMVHGRFQPFHNGHLDYFQKALARCHHLIVGITNPDPFEIEEEPASAHRHLEESNPFTYFQRVQMVRAALADSRIDSEQLTLVPFSITHPEKWPHYLPPTRSVVQYLRVFSDWERSKAERLRANGFAVEVLDEGAPKELSATEVRREMAVGEGWRRLVPPGVAAVIERVRAGEL